MNRERANPRLVERTASTLGDEGPPREIGLQHWEVQGSPGGLCTATGLA